MTTTYLSKKTHLFRSLLVLLGFVALLQLAGCASQLRRPLAPLNISIVAVELVDGSTGQIRLNARGSIRNPNEFNVKRVGFTYQVLVEDQLIDSGDVESNAEFVFKSNSEFSLPVRIPTKMLGGYVAASNLKQVRYTIDLQLTDERYMRATNVYNGAVNLAQLLKLPEIYAKGVSQNNQLHLDAVIHNPNPFILVVDGCQVRFPDQSIRPVEILASEALPPNDQVRFYIPTSYPAKPGDTTNLVANCNIDGTDITLPLTLAIVKGSE